MGTMAAAINLATEAEKKKKNAAALTALSANKAPGVGASTAATNQQSVTASALSPTAATTSSGSTTVNPYLDTDGSKKASFVASLQPDIRKATDAVTSSVNPFMTGNVGSSLLRDVQSPALKAISEYDLGQQEKATDWQANKQTTDKQTLISGLTTQVSTLKDSIENYAGDKSSTQYKQWVKDYNEAIQKLWTAQGITGSAPTYEIGMGTDYTQPTSPSKTVSETDKPAYTTAVKTWEGIAKQMPSSITDGNKDRTADKAWAYYDDLGTKMDAAVNGGVALTAAELADFNALTTLFKKYIQGGFSDEYKNSSDFNPYTNKTVA